MKPFSPTKILDTSLGFFSRVPFRNFSRASHLTIKLFFLLLAGFLLAKLVLPSPVSAESTSQPAWDKGPAYVDQDQYQYQEELLEPQPEEMSLIKFSKYNLNYLIGGLAMNITGTYPGAENWPGAAQAYSPGAISVASNLTSTLIVNPPISTTEYLADLGSSLGIVRPAYAQGTGWNALQPVLEVWKAFRNVAYLIFVIIFIFVGFMIMFRAKINPQTVISVEAAIPNLIITLIIITFSYAIASLMVDLIYVGIYLAISLFTSHNIVGVGDSTMTDDLLGRNVLSLGFSGVFMAGSGNAQSLAGNASRAIGETVEAILWRGKEVGGTLPGAVTSGLAYLIIAVAMLFSLFKLFFQLLMSYVGLILSVIFAPLALVANALPGNQAMVNWIKGMLANVLVFPATVVLFMIAAALTGSDYWGAGEGIGFVEQEGIGQGLPLLGGIDINAMKAIIGLGIILMAPKVVDMVKNALKVEKGAGYAGYALGNMLGLAGMPTQMLGQAVTVMQAKSYIMPPKQPEGRTAQALEGYDTARKTA